MELGKESLTAAPLSGPGSVHGNRAATICDSDENLPMLVCHLLSLFLSRFGSRCARIFRLVLQKKHLEQKQVEDFAMIPAKEAKDMLYKMLSENFISLQVTDGTMVTNLGTGLGRKKLLRQTS